LTVNGTGFTSGSVVNWNGSGLATTFVSGSQLTAIVPAVDIASASTAWVTVVNPAPGGGTSNTGFFPITTPSSTVTFNRTDIQMGTETSSGAVADLNGDGKLDLVLAENANDAVAVLLGNGDGTFQPQVVYPEGSPGSAPDSLAVRDLNGDGALDIVVRNELVSTVSILLGRGDGTFGASTDYATGNGYSQLVVGDFNGDGKLDVATTNAFDDTVSILLGKGDGTFQTHVDYASGYRPIPLAAGDVNGDGKLDLVIGNTYSTGFTVLLGNGDGTFQSPKTYTTVYDPESVILADFDGDGILDLSIGSEAGGIPGIDILLGNGDGTFRSLTKLGTSCGNNFNVCDGATADMNGDGKLDLVMRNSPADEAQVLLGNGDGTFNSPIIFPTGNNPEQALIGDFNGDGRLDFFMPNFYANFGSVFMQQTPGPAATLSLSSLFFGGQLLFTSSLPQSVTLTNTGTETLDISGISVSGSFSERTDCGSSLSAGRHCTITVIFHATRLGNSYGNVTITDNAASSPQTLALTGVGTGVTISPGGLAFGPQNVGTNSSPQTITLTNHLSGEAVPIYSAGIHGRSSPSFTEESTCGTSVAAGASCTFSVTFNPLSKGAKAATLEIRYGGGGYPVELTGTGQ
jgi:hypothetical protein